MTVKKSAFSKNAKPKALQSSFLKQKAIYQVNFFVKKGGSSNFINAVIHIQIISVNILILFVIYLKYEVIYVKLKKVKI